MLPHRLDYPISPIPSRTKGRELSSNVDSGGSNIRYFTVSHRRSVTESLVGRKAEPFSSRMGSDTEKKLKVQRGNENRIYDYLLFIYRQAIKKVHIVGFSLVRSKENAITNQIEYTGHYRKYRYKKLRPTCSLSSLKSTISHFLSIIESWYSNNHICNTL